MGEHVAFCGTRANETNITLFVDGKALLASTGPNSIGLINWTPDGKHLYWTSAEKGSDRPQPYARVVLDAAPTSLTFSDGDMPPYPGPWEVGAHGALQIVLFDGATAKRYRITPGSSNIETALAAAKYDASDRGFTTTRSTRERPLQSG